MEIINWLGNLHKEVVGLFHCLQLFRFTRDSYRNNSKLKSADHSIINWIMKSSSVDLIIKVARLCEANRDTESYVQFLQALKRSPYLTREYFKSLYKNDYQELRDRADSDFDKLAGKNEKSYSVKKIEEDIQKLTKSIPCKKIINYRNEYVAHLSKVKNPAPTYHDLFRATQILRKIDKKYCLLLKGQNVMSHTPTIQGDWQYVYTIPWKKVRKA